MTCPYQMDHMTDDYSTPASPDLHLPNKINHICGSLPRIEPSPHILDAKIGSEGTGTSSKSHMVQLGANYMCR